MFELNLESFHVFIFIYSHLIFSGFKVSISAFNLKLLLLLYHYKTYMPHSNTDS